MVLAIEILQVLLELIVVLRIDLSPPAARRLRAGDAFVPRDLQKRLNGSQGVEVSVFGRNLASGEGDHFAVYTVRL